MGRPPLGGQPAFRFLPTEIAEMEKALEESKGANPPKETIVYLAEKFCASPERVGKFTVQWKQIWNWFQNRRHAQRAKTAKMVVALSPVPSSYDDSIAKRASTDSSAALSEAWGLLVQEEQPPKGEEEGTPDQAFAGRHRGRGRGRGRGRNYSQISRGKKAPDSPKMEFEARSARDMAWYDVAGFLTHRMLEADDPEVQVRYAGFGEEEDEWVNVKRSVRRRSLPCEVSECVAVLPGDLILCFQEGREQALYYDAHVLDVQRKRHDIRGCRCRFLVQYDHDHSEEVVPLRKVCRRPETDFRLLALHASKRSFTTEDSQGPQQIKDFSLSKDCLVMPPVDTGSRDFMDPNNQHAGTERTSIDIADDTHISVIPPQCVSETASVLNVKIRNPYISPSVTQILDSNIADAEKKPVDQ